MLGVGRRWRVSVRVERWLKRLIRLAERTSAVGDGRGDPAILFMRLHQTLKGGFRFLATEGLFRFSGFSADPPLRERERQARLERTRAGPPFPPSVLKRAVVGVWFLNQCDMWTDTGHGSFGTGQMAGKLLGEGTGETHGRCLLKRWALAPSELGRTHPLPGPEREGQPYLQSIHADCSRLSPRQILS